MQHARPHGRAPFGRRLDALMQSARAIRATTVDEASGRCLVLSLEVAALAQARGIEVDLIVWSVGGDPSFLDHWALLLDDKRVVDPTRVQVDGSTELLHDVNDYPANFRRARRYPASLLLAIYRDRPARHGGEAALLDAGFLWRLRWHLLRHDLSRALRLRAARPAGHALLSSMKFCAMDAPRRLGALLEGRRDRLRNRLNADAKAAAFGGASRAPHGGPHGVN